MYVKIIEVQISEYFYFLSIIITPQSSFVKSVWIRN
jgi:hypothetical protein